MSMDATNVRDQIIASLFRKVNADGIIEETYVSHVKIWEEVTPVPNAPAPDPGAMKPRYILIAVSHTGQGLIYKAKRNPSGSFSIGKKWLLADLKAIEVISKRGFSMTIAKTYKWSAEKEDEMINFIISTSHLCSRLYPGKTLAVAGIQVPPVPPIPFERTRSSNDGRATQPHPSTLPAVPVRRPTNEDDGGKAPTPTPGPSSLRRPALQPGSSSDQSLAYAQPTRVGSPGPVSTQASGSRSRTPVSSNLRGSAATSTATLSPPASIIRTKSTADLDTKPPPVPSALKTVSNNGSQPGTTRPSSPSIKPDGTDAFKEQLNITAHHAPARRSSPSPSRRPTKLNDITDASLESPPKATDGGASGSELPEKAMDRLVESLEADGLNGNILPPLDDEYGAEGTMASVEEMIDEFEWNTIHISSDDDSFSASMRGRKRARAAADQIEARLQDELMALEKANTYSFLESDDRILVVMKMIDDAVRVLDDMNGLVSSYKSQLNSVSEDISYIQSRDRGLQVQNQNQNALLNEINQLLQTVHVDRDALVELIHGSLDSDAGIQKLEIAAAELYKAMLAARETDMAATIERLSEYETHNNQFTTRLVGFLTVMFTAQATLNSSASEPGKKYPTLPSHEKMELYIGRYSGLILYMREMDETKYSKVCATYYSVSSEMHGKEMKALFSSYMDLCKKASDEGEEIGGFSTTNLSRMNTQLKRGNTLIKSPSEPRKDRERGLTVSEAFGRVLGQIIPHIYREQNFIADFLQINDSSITFADYMGLESYFRRQAARAWGLNPATARLAQGALDLIFGFVPDALKQWTDGALAKDNIQIIGIMSNLERFAVDAEERGNAFLQKLLQKQSQRLTAAFNHLVDDQIKAIEQTKLTTKKRKGVAHFIRYFPIFLNKVETQLIGADTLEIRGSVDSAYDQIVQAMFESLQHMAKLDGAESQSAEDKGMLNYHVILIENMHYFVAEISQQELGAVQGFLRRAEAIYDENLSAYVKLVLRRSMGKILDYFEGVERLLTTTAPSEVHNHSNYSKSALKRILKEYTAKDIRRHVEALHKRVEKHFSTAAETSAEAEGQSLASGPVMVGVWKACEEEMIRDTNTFRRLIEQCYKSDGMSLEYTVSDIEQHFAQRRAR